VLFAAHRPFLLFLRVAGESVWNSATTSGIFGWWMGGRAIEKRIALGWVNNLFRFMKRLTL
jgi:hypothetical protein